MFAYCGNNPIANCDPRGMWTVATDILKGGPVGLPSSSTGYSQALSKSNPPSVDQKDVIAERLNNELSFALSSTRNIRGDIAFVSTGVGIALMLKGISVGPAIVVIDVSMWFLELLDRVINGRAD